MNADRCTLHYMPKASPGFWFGGGTPDKISMASKKFRFEKNFEKF